MRNAAQSSASRRRKKEAHAELEASAQKAKDELKVARSKISQLAAYLSFATTENIKLRAQLEGRQADAMVAQLQAQIPRADLHGEGPSSKVRTYTYVFVFLFVLVCVRLFCDGRLIAGRGQYASLVR